MKLCSAPREHFMISQQQLCQQPLVFFPVHLFFCQQVACPTFVEQIYLYNWEISQMLTNYSAAAQDCSTLACLPLKCYVLLWSVPCWLPWAASYISTQDFRQRWTALWWWRNIFQIILQSFNTFTQHKCPNTLVYNKRKLINKGFIALGTYISLLPFVVLFKILSVQGLKLLLCQLQADGFFCFACKWYRALIMIGQMPRSHFWLVSGNITIL